MRSIALTYMKVLPLVVLIWPMVGCASAPNASHGNIVHTVNVGQDIAPLQIDAGRGDEVRWVNKRSHPFAVIFPGTDASRVSCRKGFESVGQTVLSATVAPSSSASLCFSEQGKYDYQVRLDTNVANVVTDRSATVWIVGRGERNPKPGEQFENITP